MSLATNPRLIKELLTLRDRGHSVRAVVGAPFSWASRFDETLAANLDLPVTGVPFGPGIGTMTRLRQVLPRVAARTLLKIKPVDWTALNAVAFHDTAFGLAKGAAAQSADLFIAHYVEALPAAARAAARHGALYAFDAEDFHLGNLPDTPEHAVEKHIIRSIERRYLPGAAFVTAASPLIARAYAETYGIPEPTVILNVFPRANGPSGPTDRGAARPGPSVYWFSQTIGPGRGLECAIIAISRARSKPHLYLRGSVRDVHRRSLEQAAAEAGVADRLHFLPTVPPEDLERLGGDYDLGYVGELAETQNRQLALTNKLFSYLTSGLPVIASNIHSHVAIAERLGEAVSIFQLNDPDSLAASMDSYLLDSGRLARARNAAWALGQGEFSWEAEQSRLIETIEAALADRPAGAI